MVTLAKKKIKYQGFSALEVLKKTRNCNNCKAEEIKKNIITLRFEIGAGPGNLTSYFIIVPFLKMIESMLLVPVGISLITVARKK